VTLTWLSTVLWIVWGGLAYRRKEIAKLAKRMAAEREANLIRARGENGDDSEENEYDGKKRWRTIMLTNVPPDSEYLKMLLIAKL
jgi:hypothetical protein